MFNCDSLAEKINNLSHKLDECKSDIKRIEEASGYNISELTDLFLSKQVIIKEDIDSKKQKKN